MSWFTNTLNSLQNTSVTTQKTVSEPRKMDVFLKDMSGLMGLTDDVVDVINKLKSGAITGQNGQVYNPNQPNNGGIIQPGGGIGINQQYTPEVQSNTGPPKIALVAGGSLVALVGAFLIFKNKNA
ncbi:hypothetical protein BKI52_02685 [marine bacterium AO1-C]|nr:hypothetical protein BKI52_02685 [marine bacterium AO1-C]